MNYKKKAIIFGPIALTFYLLTKNIKSNIAVRANARSIILSITDKRQMVVKGKLSSNSHGLYL